MDLSRITAPEARERVERDGYLLLDVRSAAEFAAEHAEGAYNIPLLHKQPEGMVSNPDFAKVVQANFPDKAAKLITTCAMGGRSSRAAQALIALGYTAIIDLRGGFEGERDEAGEVVVPGWKAAGLPVATEARGRSYVELYGRLSAPKSVPPAPKVAPAEAPPADASAPAPLNRFADPARLVDCVKLGRKLPGLRRRPLGGALGERVFTTISAEAWALWVEHSKLVINEYRLNPADPPAQEMLIKQCEAFLFGEGTAEQPKDFRPQ